MIKLDISIGDTILVGKFRNRPVEVKTISEDEHGLPLINGKIGIMKIRIKKLEPKKKLKENNMIDVDSNVKVLLAGEYQNKSGVVIQAGKDGKFLVVKFPNGKTASFHQSDLKLKESFNIKDIIKEELSKVLNEDDNFYKKSSEIIDKILLDKEIKKLWHDNFSNRDIAWLGHYIQTALKRKEKLDSSKFLSDVNINDVLRMKINQLYHKYKSS